jgi:hypothetical protein
MLLPALFLLTGCSTTDAAGNKPAITFESEYDAVLDFAEKYGRSSGEYGATIMRTQDGRFYYTIPNYNEDRTVIPSLPTMEQFATDTIVAQCHSHPASDDVGFLIPSYEDAVAACTSQICSRSYVVGSEGDIFLLDRVEGDPLFSHDATEDFKIYTAFNLEVVVLKGRFKDMSPIKLVDLARWVLGE